MLQVSDEGKDIPQVDVASGTSEASLLEGCLKRGVQKGKKDTGSSDSLQR